MAAAVLRILDETSTGERLNELTAVSVILSKALLLAADTKIKDETILRQIRG